MRSSSSESDRTYESSCNEKSSDRRRLSSSAARRRSCSERISRCRNRHNTMAAPAKISAIAIVANCSGCCRSWSMYNYIQLSILRINLVLCLSLAACGTESRPGVSRVWPEMGTMMSAAAWGTDSVRVARALEAVRDSVDRIDSLLQRHLSIAALDSVRREIRRRTGVALAVDSIAPGYALDRATPALANVVDSALLAPDALTANAWAVAFLALGCERALTQAGGLSVVCADSAGVRWTSELQNRVLIPAARGP